MQTVYCSQCGHANFGDARFCAKCGREISTAASSTGTAPTRVPGSPVPPPKTARPPVRKSIWVMGSLAIVAMLTGVTFLIGSGPSEADKQRAAERAAEDKQAGDGVRMLEAPSQYLLAQNPVYHDKGIINDYRQLVQLTVLNRSTVAVQDISGQVDWINDAGAVVGSIPLSLKGSLAAGETKTFSTAAGTMTNGTMETSAKKGRIRFTHVNLVN